MKRTYKNSCYGCIVLPKCDRYQFNSCCAKWNRFRNKFAKISTNLFEEGKIDREVYMTYLDKLHSAKLKSIAMDGYNIVFNVESELVKFE